MDWTLWFIITFVCLCLSTIVITLCLCLMCLVTIVKTITNNRRDTDRHWTLWLDDVREPYLLIDGQKKIGPCLRDFEDTGLPTGLDNLHWAKSTEEAKRLVETLGAPSFMYLDHDLGWNDDSMMFLKWLAEFDFESAPEYYVISGNPVGKKNIYAFMDSWRKSVRE